MQPKWPFQAEPSCWPWVGLSELSMSRMMQSGGVRSCTRSIQAPGKSISASRLASLASHSVSKAPHLAAARGQAIQPLTTNDRPHRGITGQPLGVVDVLVAGEPAEHRLAEQPAQ